ncbi:hypothetical protein DM860_002305 [Cuscuta australis]|uniref:SBP-type domain-containing protein n=1 Tax=Cuscuta australis TaxID=267555 RepID=A0A328CXX5_9ASTE|nr:hypothetical protein DM860_002305 [Cuscuta australis]
MESLSCVFEDRGFMFSDELPLDSFTRSRSHKEELSLNPFSDHHEINEGEVFTESSLAEMLQRSETDNDLRETTKRMSPKSNTESKQVKRARTTNFSSKQALVCQVLGCNRDLGSSKDYHKRHKVCDEHSKTPKVIVNGMEQRFCQQCSRQPKRYHGWICNKHKTICRFHMLAEFDDDKRSCRKRLVGHNERRRKPHRECLWDIAGPRLLDMPRGRNSIGSHSLLSAHSRNVLRNSKMGRENCHSGTIMNGF